MSDYDDDPPVAVTPEAVDEFLRWMWAAGPPGTPPATGMLIHHAQTVHRADWDGIATYEVVQARGTTIAVVGGCPNQAMDILTETVVAVRPIAWVEV